MFGFYRAPWRIVSWRSWPGSNAYSGRSIGFDAGIAFAILLALTTVAHAEATAAAVDQLRGEAQAQRLALDFDGKTFSGPGYERLLDEGRRAHFFLVGEEHGIAENPRLFAQLFSDLAESGYRRLAIEISPPMAAIVDHTLLAEGIDGLRRLYATPGGEPAFFGMREEAELLAAVRAAVPAGQPAFWGTDYEVASDRPLIRELERADPPATAIAPLTALVQASAESWSRYAETGSPQYIFSFAGSPTLVADLRTAWPAPAPWVASILDTLEETLEINTLWTSGNGYASNVRRGALMRRNFLTHWLALDANAPRPRIMVKLGASHVVRGLNMTSTWDLGSLVPELAETEGLSSVSVMVLPGPDALIARLDPTRWRYVEAPAKDGYAAGLEPLLDVAFEDRFTLIDLAPLRRRITARSTGAHPDLVRIATGFDFLLIMSGSTPSTELDHDAAPID